MITDIAHFFNNLWRWKCGYKELSAPMAIPQTYEGVLKLNWCPEFIKYMQNRMVMGFFRYGPMSKKTGLYDNMGSIEKRLKFYKETGNDEILIDIANLCMCEFVNGTHPNKHFDAIDDGIHTSRRS